MLTFDDGALILGGGLAFTSHPPEADLSIFFTISGSSMKDNIFIFPPHPRLREDKLRAGKGIHLVDFLDQSCPIFSVLPGPDRSPVMYT